MKKKIDCSSTNRVLLNVKIRTKKKEVSRDHRLQMETCHKKL